jgi:NAD+ diphosphatase
MTSSARSRENFFTAPELDRASQFREDASWLAAATQSPRARFLLLDTEGRALLTSDHGHLLVVSHETAALHGAGPPSFLGRTPEAEYFALRLDADAASRVAATLGGAFIELRRAGASLPAFDAGVFAYARGLVHWQQRTRFCPACAAPLRLEASGHRARCTNPQCGLEHFPRIDPAVIMIVDDGARCLLGRGRNWAEGRFSTLAGFVEPGETLEDAVRREVLEETGVHVADCNYHSSQPWPFPASIMLGFTARAASTAITLGDELADARWFSADALIAGITDGSLTVSSPLSVSFKLIEHWLRERVGVELTQVTAAVTGTKG